MRKVDTITKIGGKDMEVSVAGVKNWKSYYTIFAIALCFVFFVNAISVVYKIFDVKNDVTYAVQRVITNFWRISMSVMISQKRGSIFWMQKLRWKPSQAIVGF